MASPFKMRQTMTSFYADEITGMLPIKYRDFFKSMWHLSNDLGVGPLSIPEIKAKLYPLLAEIDGAYIKDCLNYLEHEIKKENEEGLIFTYTHALKKWFLIPTFPRHQESKQKRGTDRSGYPPPVAFKLVGQLWMRKGTEELQYDLGRLGNKHGAE